MKFDPSQLNAIESIQSWYTCPEPEKLYFTLAGRAGTGKSTIISEVIGRLGIPAAKVAYVAPTGKAAEVLKSKGVKHAQTLHSLIYRLEEIHKAPEPISKLKIGNIESLIDALSTGDTPAAVTTELNSEIAKARLTQSSERGELIFKRHEGIAKFDLVVVDEASMLNDENITDLESYGIKVLYVGDHHQLPPVKGSNSRIYNPDVTLETIHRQSGISGILQLASDILDSPRGYVSRSWGCTSDVIVMSFDDFMKKFVRYGIEFPDQILCAKNNYRLALNYYIRKLMGFTQPVPEVGDKLICIKNNFKRSDPIYNGMQGTVTEIIDDSHPAKLKLRFRSYSGTELTLNVKRGVFTPNLHEDCDDDEDDPESKAEEFEFGYAVTVHKSQGSEWKAVTYLSSTFGELTKSLNYTAVTRAKEKLVVVLPPSKAEDKAFFEMI